MTEGKPGRRKKPGRPRKNVPGRINATVRFTPRNYAELKASADSEGRSFSEEIEYRVGLTLIGAIDLYVAAERRALEQLEKAMARIAELEATPALSEEAIERAVTRALAKARLTISESGK